MLTLVILLLILPPSIFFLLHKRKLQKSPSPPGPPGLPFLGNLLHLDAAAPHIHLRKLARKYGPLMSLKLGSVPVVVVSSRETAREVMKTHDLAFSSRPDFLGQRRLSYNGLDVAFAPYGESWREMRKICVVHLLSNKRVQSFRPIREEEVCRTMSNLSAAAKTPVRAASQGGSHLPTECIGGGPHSSSSSFMGKVVNLSAMMLDLTSGLICRVAFGKARDEEELRRRRFDELMIESQSVQGGFAFVSDYLPWFGWVDRVSGMIGRLDRIFKDFDDFFEELIHEHLDQSRSESSMDSNILDILIQLKKEDSTSVALTWDHVKAILWDIFVAGTDTGAATLIWAMTALIKNPTTMKRLQKEIIELVGDRRQLDEDDIPKLPYLNAVIKETLRLFPPAPLLLPRESMQNCNINGYDIPAKTLVFINAWAIARDSENWENPNEFMPERFLNSTIDVIGTNFEVIPFGAGRRGCPGIAMGLATVELALASLVHSFDWELPPGMTKQDIDTEVSPGLTMHKKVPLCLVPVNRYIIDHDS